MPNYNDMYIASLIHSDVTTLHVIHYFCILSSVPSGHSWRFRLPWPLMDITTVKIPVSNVNIKCVQYAQRKNNYQA